MKKWKLFLASVAIATAIRVDRL